MSAAFDLSFNATGKLEFVDANGVSHESVRPVRLFPLTHPELWISIQTSQGAELVCVEDPSALPDKIRTVLFQALAGREFVPVIRSITRITRAAEGFDWRVVTDRGETTFRVENDESIQTLGATRIVIIDRNNTRYLIPNSAALDSESKRKLERYC